MIFSIVLVANSFAQAAFEEDGCLADILTVSPSSTSRRSRTKPITQTNYPRSTRSTPHCSPSVARQVFAPKSIGSPS